MSDPVYYRIYLNRDEKVTIVCMQSFDECDYSLQRFYCDESGERYKFENEEDAIKLLNNKFLRQCIDQEYLSPENLFSDKLLRQ